MHTNIFTYFTFVGGSRLLYSAESWTKIRLRLETAGPVAVSTRQEITPVLSGKGILLPVGIPIDFNIPKGDRLFITAGAINRVTVFTEPGQDDPELAATVSSKIAAALGLLGRIGRGIRPSSSAKRRGAEVAPPECAPSLTPFTLED